MSQAGFDVVSRVSADQVEYDLLEQGQVLWGIVFSYLAGVFGEIDIEHPMKLVLNPPVGTHRHSHLLGGDISRTDVEPLFQFGRFAADYAEGGHATDRLALRPKRGIDMACCRQGVTDLSDNATMGRFNMFLRKPFVRVINESGLDFCQQCWLIALDRQQVREYIKKQEQEDERLDQLGLWR